MGSSDAAPGSIEDCLMVHLPVVLSIVMTIAATFQDEPAEPAFDVVATLERAVSEAIERARPSVVTIDRLKSADGSTLAIRGALLDPGGINRVDLLALNGMGMIVEPNSADLPSFDFGSGVVIGDEGQIVTAYHVVEGAARLTVRADGFEPFDAVIIAADPRSDLAVIVPRLRPGDVQDGPRLRPIPLGNAESLRPGSFLIALGNAYNAARDGRASASFGILSNTARRLIPARNPYGQSVPTQLHHFSTLFQLDAKLNQGLSGGAVVNMSGELVAITTASANAVGYDPRAGYAIPLDTLGRHAIDALIEGREVEYGFLGISLDSPTSTIREVQPGTPAGEGGLVKGDVIEEVAGRAVDGYEDLVKAVNPLPVGEPVELTIRRQERSLNTSVVLSKLPIEGNVIATTLPPLWRGLRVDFSSVVTPRGELPFDAMARGGVGVTSVVGDSPAGRAGIEPGTIILAVEGDAVRKPSEFLERVTEFEGEEVRLETDRGEVIVPSKGLVDDD